MAQTRETTAMNHGWIQELARYEVQGEDNLPVHLLLEKNIHHETVRFLTELKLLFEECVGLFNTYSQSGSEFPEIKIYSSGTGPQDFLLYRNQTKLLIQSPQLGFVQIAVKQHQNSTVAFNGTLQSVEQDLAVHEIRCQVGAFQTFTWKANDQEISPEELVRYFFSEFTRMTKDSRRGKASNQLLLDQIKALLQQKGLEL